MATTYLYHPKNFNLTPLGVKSFEIPSGISIVN